MHLRHALAFALISATFAPLASADRVVTLDNRVLNPNKARAKDGGYVLEFEHGTIVLADRLLVKEVEIGGDMSDYVPQSSVLENLDKDDEAEADMRKAIELEPLTARYRWQLGEMLYHGFAGFADEDSGMTITVDQKHALKVPEDALSQFGLASELDKESWGELFDKLPKQ